MSKYEPKRKGGVQDMLKALKTIVVIVSTVGPILIEVLESSDKGK